MKQEIWRFDNDGWLCLDSRRITMVAIAYSNGWRIDSFPEIGGVRMKPSVGLAESTEESKLAVARKIRRQLAAHGVKVEIRRVSKGCPVATDESPKQTVVHMSLGTAIEWMLTHPNEELVDSDGDTWSFDGDDRFMLNDEEGNPALELMLSRTFTVKP